jgi:hypothetical protein
MGSEDPRSDLWSDGYGFPHSFLAWGVENDERQKEGWGEESGGKDTGPIHPWGKGFLHRGGFRYY